MEFFVLCTEAALPKTPIPEPIKKTIPKLIQWESNSANQWTAGVLKITGKGRKDDT